MSKDRRSEISSRVAGMGLSDLLGKPSPQRHPLDGFGFQASDDLYLIDPHRIVQEGPYVRTYLKEDSDEFKSFVSAVEEAGEIKQPIGIRTAGSTTDRRYILIYGMRRWKAALASGLSKIPVRDYGEISEEESISIQMIENEAREDPHPVDTAVGFHLMVAGGRSQSDAARITSRTRGYVSVMRAVGEAIAGLSDQDREKLYTSPAATVRTFQEIAKLESVKDRKAALRRLLSPKQGGAGKPARSSGPFQSRATRDGRRFRVEWKEQDLRADPEGLTQTLLKGLREEQRALVERLRALLEDPNAGADQAAVRRAIAELEVALGE